MSLLLSSLKKADEESAKAAQETAAPAQAAAAQAAPPAAGGAAAPAPAASPAAPTSRLAVATPPAPAGGAIDFDSMVDDNVAAAQKPEEKEKRELVSASRIFRAKGEEDEVGPSGRSRLVYGLLGVVLIFGGGGGLLVSGLIPGVSVSSLINMFSSAPVVVRTQPTGPVLEAGGDDAALLLPEPIVDIQSEVINFAGLDQSEELLATPEGRRELAQKIAILTGVSSGDGGIDVSLLGGFELEQVTEIEEEVEVDSEIIQVKTAAVSRERKQVLDSSTPVDIILRRSVKHNSALKAEEAVAQTSTDTGEAAAESAAPESSEAASPAESSAESGESAAPEEEEAVKIAPSLSGVDRRRMLSEAAKLYISGAYAEAEAAYRNILSKNATNIDALRGLALAAVATGRYQLAVATYLRILEYYPDDPVAIADLANLHGVSGENFYAIEEALKRVLGKRPEWDGRLYFALGNLYAGNKRWLDAQQAYFDAYANEQQNPDYAYNLAVVLDYLNKPQLAVNYYRQALDLSKHMPVGFDARQVENRINSISK